MRALSKQITSDDRYPVWVFPIGSTYWGIGCEVNLNMGGNTLERP